MKAGELIVCCKRQLIMGLCVALEPAHVDAPKLPGIDRPNRWHALGWELPVKFVRAKQPLLRAEVVSGITLPMGQNGPFAANGLTQTYLTKIPHSVAAEIVDRLVDALGPLFDAETESAVADSVPDETTRKRLVDARIGQGKFRADLLDYWDGRCCTTGVRLPELLRASHIVPWKGSDNADRLNPANGLLLTASYDAAFDKFLIALADDGTWMPAPFFTADEQERAGLGVVSNRAVKGLSPKHLPYLKKHREIAQHRWDEVAKGKPLPEGPASI